MTNQEIMQTLAYMRGMLYKCAFSGDQIMVVAECVRVLDGTMARLNEATPDAPIGTDKAQSEQEG